MSILLTTALIAFHALGSGDDVVRLVKIATDERVDAAERVSALSQLGRVDAGKAEETAQRLLASASPSLKLTAATVCAKAGRTDGEITLLQMLEDQNLELGFRGLAARRLAAVRSTQGRLLIRKMADHEAELGLSGRPLPDRESFRWGLLKALGGYANLDDLEVALKVYRASGPGAPARAIGLFGRPEALTALRESLSRQSNAGSVIEIQLAIARSGGGDGISFIQQLLKAASAIGALEGEIDLRREDVLSGRLAERVLRDLGSHPSDNRFFEDVIRILRPTVCSFCGAAWGALARMGTGGHEQRLVQIAEGLGRGRSQDALRVLAYNGAEHYTRLLGKRMGLETSAEEYLAAHASGVDRSWFPVANSSWD